MFASSNNDRPAEILKVWPARESMVRQRPAEFLSRLAVPLRRVQ
jgi:hypothetical protein